MYTDLVVFWVSHLLTINLYRSKHIPPLLFFSEKKEENFFFLGVLLEFTYGSDMLLKSAYVRLQHLHVIYTKIQHDHKKYIRFNQFTHS